MNLRTGAFLVLLCIKLATAQLNYRPEFISAGQGFRASSQFQSKSISKREVAPFGDGPEIAMHDGRGLISGSWWVAPNAAVSRIVKRQAPGGDGAEVIPHDMKKQTTFWWVAPETPFKTTKIGGGVQEPPRAQNGAAGGAADESANGDAAGGAAQAGQAGVFGATQSSQSSFSASRTVTGAAGTAGQIAGQTNQFAGQSNQFGSTSSTTATASRTIGTQTGTGLPGIPGLGTTSISKTLITKTTGLGTGINGVAANGAAVGTTNQFGQSVNTQTTGTTVGSTRTDAFSATNTLVQPGQPNVRGGVTTTGTSQKSVTTTSIAVPPVQAPGQRVDTTQFDAARTDTITTNNQNTNNISINRNINTLTSVTDTVQQQPPPDTVQTNTFASRTSTTATGSRLPFSPNAPSPGTGGTFTRTQVRTDEGITSHLLETGVQLVPYAKKTVISSPGYNYPVPTPVPCYEPNRICTPNQYCVDGFVEENLLSQFTATNQNCDTTQEQCCKIRPAPPPPPTQCPDNSYVCVPPSLCNNGKLNFDAQNAISSQQPSGQCFAPDVCCKTFGLETQSTLLTNEGYVDEVPNPANDTPIAIRPNPPRPTPPPRPNTPNGPVGGPAPPLPPPIGCSAAMNCTEPQFCSATGVITKTPVFLTPEQELYRVPVTECRSPDKGFTGVCCRDPDYVDPWPVGMLGLYNPEILPFDDGSYKPNGNNGNGNGNRNGNAITSQVTRNEAIQAAPSRVTAAQTYGPNQITSASQTQYTQAKTQYDRGVTAAASSTSTRFQQQQSTSGTTGAKRYTPPSGLQFVHNGDTRFKPFQKQGSGQCAPRNYNTQPRGAGPTGTGFGEFPWQAMVILESNKTLLCGGAIISENTVVTAANCVYGINPRDIMIKGGEWRLGVDAEPKTFQIVRVKNVVYHPAYQPTTSNYDVAMLVLEDRLRYDTHIGALCLDENDVIPSASYEKCVTTGWGREVLRIHIGNALMQQMPISLLSEADSHRELQANGFTPESHIAGRPAADACDVDIGSALACADTSGSYFLKGVYSADNGCGRPDQVVSFSNIDVQWIRQVLKNPNQFITPVPNYQTAANSPIVSTIQQPSTLGPNYGKAYLPPYK